MNDRVNRRRDFLGLSAWLGLSILELGRHAVVAGDSREQEPRQTDPSPREVVAEVTLPARRFIASEKVPFAIKMTNNSPRTVVLWSSGFWPNHRIEVWDEAGRAMPLTPEGELRARSFAPGGARRKNVAIELKPGQSWPRAAEGAAQVERGGLGLDGLFTLKPGTFTVRVTYHDEQPPTPLKVISPKVAFVIMPSNASPVPKPTGR
jgi:hypothetical protein